MASVMIVNLLQKSETMKTNKLFVIDLLLLLLFIPMAVTGFEMHVAGHGNNYSEWHGWAVAHILSTILFTIVAIWHICLHWWWYKILFKKPLGSKSRVTIVVTVIFLILTISGILALVIPEGPNSNTGIFHYKVGIVSIVLFLGHIIKRLKILRKGLFKK